MRRAAAILLLLASAVAVAQTKPADLAATVAQLGDRDPLIRDAAREALMALEASDLPRLRDAVAGTSPNATVRGGLRDAVMHVYLTGRHRFSGPGGGYIGVMTIAGEREPPTVSTRAMGFDAYRALRNGDTILAVRRPGSASFESVATTDGLKHLLGLVGVGKWVELRVARGGSTIETRLRLGPAPIRVDAVGAIPDFDSARRYWDEQFAPVLGAAATRPAGGT